MSGRRAPVHQQLPVVLVVQPQPADVLAVGTDAVQPAEHQTVLAALQLPDPVLAQCHERVAFGAGLWRSGGSRRQRLVPTCDGLCAQVVEAAEEAVDDWCSSAAAAA